MTASQARRELFPLIKRVNDDRTTVEIVSKHGNAVLMSAEEYDALMTTSYLFSDPANAARLRRSLADAAAGRFEEHELIQ
ncbi:MAG: type II toxin-antitoxin system prevent-host-death family antitoxin [Propionibacteriaceae bacterium]|jgi:antitoxin YefM|nr:type II toxin-antitoxin system prevent-host-death family antitoxin [Propionibacteriaceae bacterium]